MGPNVNSLAAPLQSVVGFLGEEDYSSHGDLVPAVSQQIVPTDLVNFHISSEH